MSLPTPLPSADVGPVDFCLIPQTRFGLCSTRQDKQCPPILDIDVTLVDTNFHTPRLYRAFRHHQELSRSGVIHRHIAWGALSSRVWRGREAMGETSGSRRGSLLLPDRGFAPLHGAVLIVYRKDAAPVVLATGRRSRGRPYSTPDPASF